MKGCTNVSRQKIERKNNNNHFFAILKDRDRLELSPRCHHNGYGVAVEHIPQQLAPSSLTNTLKKFDKLMRNIIFIKCRNCSGCTVAVWFIIKASGVGLVQSLVSQRYSPG